jgi:ParB family chromosome partitioning protein
VQTKWGLGRGIEALLPSSSDKTERTGYLFLPLDKIKANPSQPRKHFDETALEELAASMREHGVIEPIIVEEAGGGFYLVVAGERRCRAAILAGLREVPALVRDYSEEKRLEISIIENIQREGLNPIEEAAAFRQLMELSGLSQDEAAAKVGKSRSALANTLRLLKLPDPVQDALKTGAITQGHARAILAVENGDRQLTLFGEIVENTLSVRETEARAAELNNIPMNPNSLFSEKIFDQGESPAQPAVSAGPVAPVPAVAKVRDPHLVDMEQRFIDNLGTKVRIDGGANAGSIRIEYYSMEDLDRLYEIIVR